MTNSSVCDELCGDSPPWCHVNAKHRFSAGDVAGIVVGSILAVIVVIAIGIIVLKRRDSASARETARETIIG
jgi:hypothetical protein